MYFDYIYQLNDFYINLFIPELEGKGCLIIPVKKDIVSKRKFYLELLQASTASFCFGLLDPELLSNGHNDWVHIANSLTVFLFLPNYIRKANSYLLVLDEEAGYSLSVLSHFEKLLSRQGINHLTKDHVYHENERYIGNRQCYYISQFFNENSLTDLNNYEVIFNDIISRNAINKKIVLPVTDENSYIRVEEWKNSFEQWIFNNKGSYFKVLLDLKKSDEENERIRTENEKLKFRMDNYNDYLNLLRETAIRHVAEYNRINSEAQALRSNDSGNSNTSHQLSQQGNPAQNNNYNLQVELEKITAHRNTILNWYIKEYEVLPLWYKRVGHVIKILTGKRTLKSYLKKNRREP